jgi:hypothetical protein
MLSLFAESGSWLVVVTTILVVMLCVVLHYEVLSNSGALLTRISNHRRWRIVALISMILITHVAEIWLFALGYFLLTGMGDVGTLSGLDPNSIGDFAYYSAMVYTTVGFGDITPIGHIRFMTGMEALSGLVMITWSASFAFLEMQRNWRSD